MQIFPLELITICLNCVHCVGDAVVDCIKGPPEPSGSCSVNTAPTSKYAPELMTEITSKETTSSDRMYGLTETSNSSKRTGIYSNSSTHKTKSTTQIQSTSINKITSPLPKREKLSKVNVGEDEAQSDWKKSIIDLESKRFKAEDNKRCLECYNLALQSITLERQLGTVDLYVDIIFLF